MGLFLAATCVGILVCTFGYLLCFEPALIDGDWLDVKGFTRIVIPDVFLYISLTDRMNEFEWLQVAIAGVKNALGPALMWRLGGQNWYGMAAVNTLVAMMTLAYTIKLASHFDIPLHSTRHLAMTLALMPTTIYYSIGPAKELPTLLATTAFVYHFIKRQTFRWVVMGLSAVLFRYQLIAVLLPFVFIARYSRNPVRAAVSLMLVLAMAYPLIAKVGIVASEETGRFREESDSRAGAFIESVRDKVPIVSAAAVAVRVSQSVFEPIVNCLRPEGIIEGGSISVINVVYLFSFLPLLPYCYRTLMRIRALRKAEAQHPDIRLVYTFIVLFAVPVAGFSFVHHRYLYPLTALMLIGGYECVRISEFGADSAAGRS